MPYASPPAPELLAWAAVLHWFDHSSLRDLVPGAAPQAIEALLAASEPCANNRLGGCRQANGLAAELLRQSVRPDPAWHLAAHQAALEYLRRRLSASVADHHLPLLERCYHHLLEIYDLMVAGRLKPLVPWFKQAVVELVDVGAGWSEARIHQLAAFCETIWLPVDDTQAQDRRRLRLATLGADPTFEPALRIRTLNTLGASLFHIPAYEAAAENYRLCGMLAAAVGDDLYQGMAALNLSMISSQLGDPQSALAHLEVALGFFRAHNNPHHLAHVLYEIAHSHLYLGRFDSAGQEIDEAIAVFGGFGNSDELGHACWVRGFLWHLLGAVDASRAAYESGITHARAADNLHAERDNGFYLGFLLQCQGEFQAAIDHYTQALALPVGNAHERTLIFYRRGTACEALGDIRGAAANYRAAINLLEGLRRRTDDETMKLGLLGTTQHVYECMVRLQMECGNLARAFCYMERARSRALLDAINHQPDPTAETKTITLGALRRMLSREPGAALLEYFVIGAVSQDAGLMEAVRAVNPALYARLTPEPAVYVLGVTAGTVRGHRVCHRNGTPFDPNEIAQIESSLVPATCRRYYQTLIGPFADILCDDAPLYVIPHGPLHRVAWTALETTPATSPAPIYLVRQGGPILALAPSATVLRRCEDRLPGDRSFLAVGYNSHDLVLAEAEALLAARIMAGTALVGGTLPADVEQLIRDADILHFSCHGRYDPLHPLQSALLIGTDAGQDRWLTAARLIDCCPPCASLVVLNACSSGHSYIAPGDDLYGLERPLLLSGVRTIVSASWEVADGVALAVMESFYGFLASSSPGRALRDAVAQVRSLNGQEWLEMRERWVREAVINAEQAGRLHAAAQSTDQPLADPEHWAPFKLVGCP